MTASPVSPVSSAGGYSMIEVLVSIFIVSMGILALSGLLATAARYGKTTEVRSLAVLLANDLADRIRANAGAAASGAYDLSDPFPAPAPPATIICSLAAPCAPGPLAAADLAEWRARLRRALPQGSAYVRYNASAATAPGSVDLWVAWTEATGGAERQSGECASGLGVALDGTVRCVHLQVGLQ